MQIIGRGDARQFRRERVAHLRRRQKGGAAQAIGSSRGRCTPKIHTICNGVGRLRTFLPSHGNTATTTLAPGLLAIAPVDRTAIADKGGYNTGSLRIGSGARGSRVVIPNIATWHQTYPFDVDAYRDSRMIEQVFHQFRGCYVLFRCAGLMGMDVLRFRSQVLSV